MAHRANPATKIALHLRILIAALCLIAFAASPIACQAAMPMLEAPQATAIHMDCHPCCSHSDTPTSAAPTCCVAPQDELPARIASATIVEPAMAATPLHSTLPVQLTSIAAAAKTSTNSPPPPRLTALRI